MTIKDRNIEKILWTGFIITILAILIGAKCFGQGLTPTFRKVRLDSIAGRSDTIWITTETGSTAYLFTRNDTLFFNDIGGDKPVAGLTIGGSPYARDSVYNYEIDSGLVRSSDLAWESSGGTTSLVNSSDLLRFGSGGWQNSDYIEWDLNDQGLDIIATSDWYTYFEMIDEYIELFSQQNNGSNNWVDFYLNPNNGGNPRLYYEIKNPNYTNAWTFDANAIDNFIRSGLNNGTAFEQDTAKFKFRARTGGARFDIFTIENDSIYSYKPHKFLSGIKIGDSTVTEMYQGVIPDTNEVIRLVENHSINEAYPDLIANVDIDLKTYTFEMNNSYNQGITIDSTNKYTSLRYGGSFSTGSEILLQRNDASLYLTPDAYPLTNGFITDYNASTPITSMSSSDGATYSRLQLQDEYGKYLDNGTDIFEFNGTGIYYSSDLSGGFTNDHLINKGFADDTYVTIDDNMHLPNANTDTSDYKLMLDENDTIIKSINVYAGMYLDSNTVATTINTQDVWENVGNMTQGSVFENATYTQDTIWIDYSGIYEIGAFVSTFIVGVSDDDYEIGLSINGGLPLIESRGRSYIKDIWGNFSGSPFQYRLNQGDYLTMKIVNRTGTDNVSLLYGGITIKKLN